MPIPFVTLGDVNSGGIHGAVAIVRLMGTYPLIFP
jgi:hypothetical protein